MFNIAGQQGKLMFQRRCGNQRIPQLQTI
jgi:hypothetical protein